MRQISVLIALLLWTLVLGVEISNAEVVTVSAPLSIDNVSITSVIKVYTGSCPGGALYATSGNLISGATADVIGVDLQPNQATNFYANATNGSLVGACVGPIAYTYQPNLTPGAPGLGPIKRR